jgi:alkylation response protein AidB-like acyl-CoA dehydrogenase
MDFRPSPAQRLLIATARDYLRRHCPIELVQRLALDPRGFDDKLWRGMAELGWPGLLIPSDFGGSDGTLVDVVLLVEELGYASVPGPYVASAVAATSLLLHASAAQQKRVLPGLASGDRIATIALVEERGSFDPAAVTLACDGGRLTGRKLFVKDAHVADHLIVLTRGGGGFNLFLLPSDQPGITRSPLESISGEKLFHVAFDGVPLAATDLLGAAGRGWERLAPALDAGALARSAEMVGCAQRILELAVDYAKVRVQSGRPIGSFQAIQHACADLLRNVESARALVQHAAWTVARGADAGAASAAAVATAKAFAGDRCLEVARKAHQIFGAIGYCEEHPLHLLHKRIQAASLDFGDRATHLETVARAIGLR